MPAKAVSHYEIERKLGEGGMGEVFLARDTRLDRTVALKFLPDRLSNDPHARERLMREARAASRLSHPNILTIHEVGEDADGHAFIAMQYVPGKPLDEVIAAGPLPVDRAIEIGLQVCDALSCAHASGIVHRDIKPQNVLIDEKGRATVLDFGLAKIMDASNLTQSGAMVGTVSYMSPEQARGEACDHRSDVFSAGTLIYEMITGVNPFQGDNIAASLNAIINGSAPPASTLNPRCPAGLDRVLERAMAKDPTRRFQNASEFCLSLRSVLSPAESGPARTPMPAALISQDKPRLRRYAIPVGALVVVAVVLTGLNVGGFWKSPQVAAVAERNTLAILDFENVPDPSDSDRTAEMIQSLLITDLSESQAMSVLSRQRVREILGRLGHERSSELASAQIASLAQMAGARWILSGTVLQREPSMVVVSTVTDAQSGTVVASQRINGEDGEDIFAVIDRLSTAVRTDLSIPAGENGDGDSPVTSVTTQSPDAYRAYLAGTEAYMKLDYLGATTEFERAVALDTTFAMAYYQLSRSLWARMIRSEAVTAIEHAAQYADRASAREQMYIRGYQASLNGRPLDALAIYTDLAEKYPTETDAMMYVGSAYLARRSPEDAIRWLTRVIDLDPGRKIAYNQLAYAHYQAGQYQEAIAAIDKYIELAPEEPNPYDSRGDMLAGQGRIDAAIDSYARALEKKRDFYPSAAKLGQMYILKREYERADSVYMVFFGEGAKEVRSAGRLYLSLIPLHQGRLREALGVIDRGLEIDQMEKADAYPRASKHATKSMIYDILGKPDSALIEAAMAARVICREAPGMAPSYRACQFRSMLQAGLTDAARDSVKALHGDMMAMDSLRLAPYWYASGCLAFADGDTNSALACLKRARDASGSFFLRYPYAVACLRARRLGEAVDAFRQILGSFDEERMAELGYSVMAEYQLGLAYEASGWSNEAIDQYRKFIELWGEGDKDIPAVRDARARLVALQTRV